MFLKSLLPILKDGLMKVKWYILLFTRPVINLQIKKNLEHLSYDMDYNKGK